MGNDVEWLEFGEHVDSKEIELGWLPVCTPTLKADVHHIASDVFDHIKFDSQFFFNTSFSKVTAGNYDSVQMHYRNFQPILQLGVSNSSFPFLFNIKWI